MLPRVVWAEESKNGLRFETGPSYDVVPTTSQCPSDGQSSCTHKVAPRPQIRLTLSTFIGQGVADIQRRAFQNEIINLQRTLTKFTP